MDVLGSLEPESSKLTIILLEIDKEARACPGIAEKVPRDIGLKVETKDSKVVKVDNEDEEVPYEGNKGKLSIMVPKSSGCPSMSV